MQDDSDPSSPILIILLFSHWLKFNFMLGSLLADSIVSSVRQHYGIANGSEALGHYATSVATPAVLIQVADTYLYSHTDNAPLVSASDRVGNIGVSVPTVNRQTQAAPIQESGITTNTGSGKEQGPLWRYLQTRCRRRPPSRGRPTG